METNPEFERYRKASKKVKEIKGFYSHLISFILVNAVIMTVNLYYTPKDLWFFWVIFGWGIGLFFHALEVFKLVPFLNKDWEERKIKQFMEEEKKRKILTLITRGYELRRTNKIRSSTQTSKRN